MIDVDFWRGRRVLVTGHTGFKGAWLVLWLHSMGARVWGLASRPAPDASLFARARLDECVRSLSADIRDHEAVRAALAEARPEVVVHLAGRAILRRALEEPLETYAVNVLGTANLLEAVRRAGEGVRAVICVTSDKCYADRDWDWGYREIDALGGRDPYSSSKACQELVAAAYRGSLLPKATQVATARAGNVIGGGDWGRDRLVPDVIRAAFAGRPLEIRSPASVRAWQHVLDPLCGYLALAQRLCTHGAVFAEPWNFAPAPADARSVGWLVERLRRAWPAPLEVRLGDDAGRSVEARRMRLDSSKAEERLGWRPTWSAELTVDATIAWYLAFHEGRDLRETTRAQIASFCDDVARAAPA